MSAGLIGCMTTPAQGNIIPDGAMYAADNGRFGNGWPGADAWLTWLTETVARYGAERCLWAVAPDVPMDASATLAESAAWLPRIRALGVPAAFAAQNWSEAPGMVPWDDLDVLFLGGGIRCLPCGYDGPGIKRSKNDPPRCPTCQKHRTEWKLLRCAADLAHEATRRGKRVHMGRVSSLRRIEHARDIGCSTADGTFIAFAPDLNLPKVLRWGRELRRRQRGVQFPMFDLEETA